MSFEFLITSLVVALLPGTGVIYVLVIGLGRGFIASVVATAGCTFGIVPAATASIVGLSALFHTSTLAFQIVKYLGVVYLFYMAWTVLKRGGSMDVTHEKNTKSLARILMTGTLINVLNPKLSLFFLAFLPQFVSLHTNVTVEFIGLALTFMLVTFVVFVGYGFFASAARDYVVSRPNVLNWIKICFAGTFVFLGIRLASSD